LSRKTTDINTISSLPVPAEKAAEAMFRTPVMKERPEDEQPYELGWKYGVTALSDAQLLSVILRSGSQGDSSLDLAHRILNMSPDGSLEILHHMDQHDFLQIRGIGRVKALMLQSVAELARRMSQTGVSSRIHFHSPEEISDYYMEQMRHEEQEKVLLVLLDSGGALLGEETVFRGTVNSSIVSPRELLILALKRKAVGMVLVHNHPSGDPTPSREDISLTRRLRDCAQMCDVPLEDHIIIGDRQSFSFRRSHLVL